VDSHRCYERSGEKLSTDGCGSPGVKQNGGQQFQKLLGLFYPNLKAQRPELGQILFVYDSHLQAKWRDNQWK
jgi:hypothetical protein